MSDTKSIQILVLIRSLNAGGAERQLIALVHELHARGFRVAVAVFYGGGALSQELLRVGIPIYDLKKGGRWSIVGFVLRLSRLLWTAQPSVLHGYMGGANLVALALKPVVKLRGGKVVCGVRSSALDMSNYDRVTRLIHWLHQRLLKCADAVIFNSRAGYDHACAQGVRSPKYHVVENGVDTNLYRFSMDGRDRVRAEWGVDVDQVLIGLVGRHDVVKGHRLFLEITSRLAENTDIRFVFVGEENDELTAKLRERANSLGLNGRLIWAGYRGDLPDIYSALDVLCLPSETEGFPNVVAEAMSCGLPCVCSDVGDVRRIIGRNGWVVENRSPSAFANAIEDAIARLPAWDKQLPRASMESQFGVATLADRTLAVLAPFLRSNS